MKQTYLIIGLLSVLAFFSCSNDDLYTEDISVPAAKEGTLNLSGTTDGVSYALTNVAVNPQVVSATADDVALLSSATELENGIYKLDIFDEGMATGLSAGNVLYLQAGGTTHLRVIDNVTALPDNTYSVETSQAYLGDLFQDGTLELKVDVKQAERILKSKALKSADSESGFSFDVLNLVHDCQIGDLLFNPNSTVKTFFTIKIGFGKSKVLPNQMEVVYEVQTSISPYMSCAAALNKDYQAELTDYMPEALLNYLKTLSIDIDIPAGDLGTIPASVSIEDVYLPLSLSVNASKDVDLNYNASGSFKIGYAYYNNVPGKKSHFIYENNLTSTPVNLSNLHGEVASDLDVIIVPKVEIIGGGLLDITGNISYGFKTLSAAGTDARTNQSYAGSRGSFTSLGKFTISTLGINVITTDLFSDSKDIWNTGTFNNNIGFSNLRIAKPSKTICALASYNYEMTLDYTYPIRGKKIKGELSMTYDVLDDTGKMLRANQKLKFTPKQLTDNSFKFDVCFPFKADAWAWTAGLVKKLGYISNVKIVDENGCEAGLTDTKGNPVDRVAIGSPYNTSFWK